MELKLNENLAYLLGVICGDGTIYTKEKQEYSLANHDMELVGMGLKNTKHFYNI